MKGFADYVGNRNVTPELVYQFFDTMKQERHGCTFNRRLSDFTWWFKAIGRPDLIPDIRRSREQSIPAKYLEKSDLEVLKYKIELEEPEIWLAIKFMYNCAIRPGELRMLKIEHVLVESEKVFIPAHIAKTGKSRFARIPKNFLSDLTFIKSADPYRYLFPSPITQICLRCSMGIKAIASMICNKPLRLIIDPTYKKKSCVCGPIGLTMKESFKL